MGEEQKEQRENLSEQELEDTNGEPLPDREAMSIINPGDGFTLPVEPPAEQ